MKHVAGWAFPDADEFMATEIKPDGTYQAGHYQAALLQVTNRRLAIDCGAHVGTWTRLMSRDFGLVIAVEPSADTFEALTANMATHQCNNVDLRNVAVGVTAGRVSMAPLEPRAAAIHNTGARFIQDGGEIERVTIDSWELESCGFIKMDIEGSEVDALMGAVETLKRCRPIVLFEHKGFCRRFGHHPDGPLKFLSAHGYHELAIAGKDRIWGAL